LKALIDSFFKTSIKAFIVILGIAVIVLIIKFIPTVSLMYLYLKQYLMELYLSVIR